jgi:hypothetical protein
VDEGRAAAESFPPSLRKAVSLPGGELTLAALAAAVRKSTGREIQVPAYARERKLLAYSEDNRAGEVLRLLTQMYGWTLQTADGTRYLVARPRLVPARDVMDLHARMRAALPPLIHLLFSREAERSLVSTTRANYQIDQILTALREVRGADWERASTVELPPTLQRQICNLFLYRKFPVDDLVRSVYPRWWLVAPKEIVLRLRGEPGPGKHPMVMIQAKRPDGTIDEWGWAAHTGGTITP